VKESCIPEDWKSSVILPIYKRKGDPMECGSYRGIKLLEHAIKVVVRIFEHRIRQQIEVYAVWIYERKRNICCHFWATVCKTVRSMLSDRLSVTLVHCGQMVGRIKMKLGVRVGVGPGHTALDGDPALPPSPKGHSPNFLPISAVAKWLDGLRCHLVWR